MNNYFTSTPWELGLQFCVHYRIREQFLRLPAGILTGWKETPVFCSFMCLKHPDQELRYGWCFITFEWLHGGWIWAFGQMPWRNSLLSPRSSSLLQTDLSANRLLCCFFTEKEVNGLMEELFETVSNEFWLSGLVEFCRTLCLLLFTIVFPAEWSVCVRAT